MIKFSEFALKYAERGWAVFPLRARDKRPLPNNILSFNGEGGFKVATTDITKIEKWWSDWPESNIGVATGKASGIVVLDIDSGKGGDESLLALVGEYGKLPHTVESLTGGGGRHILFAHPGIEIHNSSGLIGDGLDIRGDGGYIVVPPSIHPSGNIYQWELSSLPSQTALAEMPAWLIEAATKKAVKEYAEVNTGANIIPKGKRDSTLASMAGSMRRRGMGEQAILTALMVENQERCEPPLPKDDIERIAGSISRYDPADVPLFPGNPNNIKKYEPLDAYAGIVIFLDLMDNLEGRSIPTYIPKLDEALGGLERQTLSVLAARPSMGKTTLGWQIARNVAASGLKSLFFSLEMSTANLWAKASCGACGCRWRDFRNGTATEEQRTMVVDKAIEMMHRYQSFLLTEDHVNTSETIWNTVDAYRPDLVLIDHIRLVADRDDSEVKRLGEISKRAKDLAKALNCHVMLLAQLNRSVEGRDNKRPQMSDLRDSGEIEENADTILMMYREDYYDDTKERSPISETEILIRKFRDDIANQRIILPFNTRQQWFG